MDNRDHEAKDYYGKYYILSAREKELWNYLMNNDILFNKAALSNTTNLKKEIDYTLNFNIYNSKYRWATHRNASIHKIIHNIQLIGRKDAESKKLLTIREQKLFDYILNTHNLYPKDNRETLYLLTTEAIDKSGERKKWQTYLEKGQTKVVDALLAYIAKEKEVEPKEEVYIDVENLEIRSLARAAEQLAESMKNTKIIKMAEVLNDSQQEKADMSNVEVTQQTLVSGKNVDDMSDGDFLHMIGNLKASIENLEKLSDVKSTKVESMVADKKQQLVDLVKLFDKRG